MLHRKKLMRPIQFKILICFIGLLFARKSNAQALLPDLLITKSGDSTICLLSKEQKSRLLVYVYDKKAKLTQMIVPNSSIIFFKKRFYTMDGGPIDRLTERFKKQLIDTSNRNILPYAQDTEFQIRLGIGYGFRAGTFSGSVSTQSSTSNLYQPSKDARADGGLAISGGIRSMGAVFGTGIAYSGLIINQTLPNDNFNRAASHYIGPEIAVRIGIPEVQFVLGGSIGGLYHTEEMNYKDYTYSALKVSSLSFGQQASLSIVVPITSKSSWIIDILYTHGNSITFSKYPFQNSDPISASLTRTNISTGVSFALSD